MSRIDITNKVPPVDGVSADDLKSAMWTFRSGVNVRCLQRVSPPSWWKRFEADLDAASVGYWRPFTLPVAKAKCADDAAAVATGAEDGTGTLEVRQIKSFFSKVSAAEADAIAAAAMSATTSKASQGKPSPLSLTSDAAKAQSIKSFFSHVSEEDAGQAAAAALAAASAKPACKRLRTAAKTPLGIQKFFGTAAVDCDSDINCNAAGVIVIDD